ncbi:helix-turn-helix transcriptional regulator [Clostridium beijerinckii]|uniref:helix-turn-helix transcriptional regulator n=1 Tax=Clostridium beijerinckii TaxID=1520 RepID=UPI00232DB545|nr:WYL domain-containing protein [Clostridium beijerinckii]
MKQNFCENAINTFISVNNSNIQGRTELADKFGVTERTISSYVKYLKEELGVEMRWDKKNKKYVVEDQGIFKEIINNSKLEPMDIWFILIILLRSQYILPTKVKIIEKELLKFVGSREKAEMEKLFAFEKTNHLEEYYHEDILNNIYTAFINKKKVKMLYRRSSEDIRKYVIEPQNITFDNGRVYLIAFNENKEDRTYRLDRIKRIEILDENKEESDFSLSDYLSKSWHMFGGREKETRIVVKFNKNAAKIIEEKVAVNKRIINEDNDSVTYEFIAYGIDGICIELLGLGDRFEVLEPVDLREKICEIGKRIVENHSN